MREREATNGLGVAFVTTLTVMSVGALLGSDTYVGAMIHVGNDFRAGVAEVQLGLGLYLFGTACSHLLFGFLADRITTSTAAIGGAVGFVVTSTACTLAPNLPTLVALRVLQGLFAGAGLVIARAVAGRRFGPARAARVTATVGISVGMAPALFPWIGGLLAGAFGWRSIFVLAGLFGVVTLILVVRNLRGDDAPPTPQLLDRHVRPADYVRIVRSPVFWASTTAPVFSYAAYYSYLSTTPFIFTAHGWSSTQFWILYLNLSLGFAAGSTATRLILTRANFDRIFWFATWLSAVGCVLAILAGFVSFTVLGLITASSVLVFANGSLLAMGVAGVAQSFKLTTGVATGTYSCIQMALSAAASTLSGLLIHGDTVRLGVYMTVLMACGCGGNVLRRHYRNQLVAVSGAPG